MREIRRIKPLLEEVEGRQVYTLLVYYADGTFERVEDENVLSFLTSNKGLPADAPIEDIQDAYGEVLEPIAITPEEIDEAEEEFGAAITGDTEHPDDEHDDHDGDDDEHDDEHDDDHDGDDDDDDDEHEEEEEEDNPERKKGIGAAGAVALAAGALVTGVGLDHIYQNLIKDNGTERQMDADNSYGEDAGIQSDKEPTNNTDNNNNNNNNNNNTNTTTGTEFEQLMASMDQNDARRVVSEDAMSIVSGFHGQTHKEGNFRLEADGEVYLDLSFDEALVLSTFANYTEPADMYKIFGTYNLTSEQAMDLLESARSKMIVYYMNATEPSGLAEMFHDEEDRAFFTQFENDVLAFNKEHTTATSDQVIRDVYYNYVLDDATVDNVGPLARLLAFDTVYGGLNLVESADVDHTQFLVFHGNGAEEETRYLVENVYHLNYDELTEEEKATYRQNIIEASTQLVDLLPNGQVMNEENSTQEQRDANWSLTDLVDRMGLCNTVNNTITELMRGLDTMEIVNESSASDQIVQINLNLVSTLYNAGEHELSAKVAGQINTPLSEDLLKELEGVSSVKGIVENYHTMIETVTKDTRPSMDQISAAAKAQIEQQENYQGYSRDIATLINNRRHTEIRLTNDGPAVGEDGAVVYPAGEYTDEFIQEHGEVIDEHTETHEEEVSYDDLTDEEQEEVEQQQAVIEAGLARDNASAQGQIAANAYANSGDYHFGMSVTDPANGAVYDLDGMSFANGLAYGNAFGNLTVSTSDAQIQAAADQAAENYLNSISAEDREAIARGMGTSWENARASLKESYKSGYMSQMQAEISTAISVGQEMKATSEAIIQEIEELNNQQQQDQNQHQDQDHDQDHDHDGVEEGEVPVGPGTGTGDDTHPDEDPDEDELDQADSGRVEEGEIPVQPGNGSNNTGNDSDDDKENEKNKEDEVVSVPVSGEVIAMPPEVGITDPVPPIVLPAESGSNVHADADADEAERVRLEAEAEAARAREAEEKAQEELLRIMEEAAKQNAKENPDNLAPTGDSNQSEYNVEEGEEEVDAEVEKAYQKSL